MHKFDAVTGTDKITKNGSVTIIRTKILNLCAMPVYEKKSMEVYYDHIFEFILIVSIISGISIGNEHNPEVVFNYFKLLPLIMILSMGVFFGWFYRKLRRETCK